MACLHQAGVSTKQTAPLHCYFARETDKCLFTQSKSLVGNASCLGWDAVDILFVYVCLAMNTHTYMIGLSNNVYTYTKHV